MVVTVSRKLESPANPTASPRSEPAPRVTPAQSISSGSPRLRRAGSGSSSSSSENPSSFSISARELRSPAIRRMALARGIDSTHRHYQRAGNHLHRSVATKNEKLLKSDGAALRLFLGKKSGGKSLPLADSLDLDGRGFNDLFDASHACDQF